MNNTPVAVIFGCPNVGKSTLFNRLTGAKKAVVDARPGVTRDRHYGYTTLMGQPWIIVDTGGFTEANADPLQPLLNQQVEIALNEADVIIWVVDAKIGRVAEDALLADKLRKCPGQIMLVANKSESLDNCTALGDFHSFGFKNCLAISSAHNQGISNLMMQLVDLCPQTTLSEDDLIRADDHDKQPIHVALLGRPNVGKSTFINALLKEERMMVSDISGTTRDSIHSPFHYRGQAYVAIDTAGMRKKSKVIKQHAEGYSVIRSLKSIEQAHVVILMCDATEGVTDQDCQLMRSIIEAGRGLVIVINKQDALTDEMRYPLQYSIDDRLGFVKFADIHHCSAIQKTGINRIMNSVKKAYISAQKTFSTSQLTKWLEQAQSDHPPPMINGRRIKLRFAHMSAGYPPYIVIHGKQTTALPKHYKRYLENAYRQYFKVSSIPIRMTFKQDDNPYAK